MMVGSTKSERRTGLTKNVHHPLHKSWAKVISVDRELCYKNFILNSLKKEINKARF